MSDNFLPVSFVTPVPTIEISDEQFERMGNYVVELRPVCREEILSDVNNYISCRYIDKVRPKANRQMSEHLMRIGNLARDLADEISGDGSAQSDAISSYMLDWNMNPDISASDLYRLGALLRHTAEILPRGKSGPVNDSHLDPLVRKLYKSFLNAGGQGIYTKDPYLDESPYSGKFSHFFPSRLRVFQRATNSPI